jgi:cobaltochelatase CobS
MKPTKKEVDESIYQVTKGIILPVNQEKRSEFVPETQDFKNVSHCIEQVAICVNEKLPVLLMGETGTGKTSLVRFLASKTQNGFRRVNHNGGTTVDDIVGKILVNKEGTYWVDGVLTEAMRKGEWYVADEINASSAEILFIYHSLLDDDGYIVLPEHNGEVVRPHANFRFFATMNPSVDYHGVKELNKALMSRFIVLKTDFPAPKVEADILTERTGISHEVAANMVKFAGDIRSAHGKDKMTFVVSTRDLLMWAQMYQIYQKYIVSSEMTILNKVGVDDFQAVKDFLAVNFKALDNPPKAKVVPTTKSKKSDGQEPTKPVVSS